MDGFNQSTYIATQMNRFFLTLLALLTGLTVQGTPAHARLAGVADTEIGTVEGGRAAVRAPVGQVSAIDAPVTRQERKQRDATRIRAPRARVYIPAVQYGVDRAHE